MISLNDLLADQNGQFRNAIDPTKAGNLLNVVKELQGLSITKVAGANANTNIAIAGIKTEDTLLSVLEFTVSGGNLTGINDRTSTSSITSDGNVQCTQSTSTSILIVVWFNKK